MFLTAILAEDEPLIRMDVKNMLEELCCQVVGECGDGSAAVNLTLKYKPDLVFLDIKMPGTDGLAAARTITEEMLIPVVLFTSYSDEKTIQKAMKSGAFGYIVKPVDKEKLRPMITVVSQRFAEMKKLRDEVNTLTSEVADRSVIDKAKGLLQKKLNCSEEEAYSLIRRQSMNQHRKMRDIAADILRQ